MKLKAYRYTFPFEKPFRTGSGFYPVRQGIIFTFQENDILALGEAAPLPGFSPETLDDLVNHLNRYGAKFRVALEEKIDTGQIMSPIGFDQLPSLQFALDTLAADFLAKKARKTLRTFLFKKSQRKLPLNALLPVDDVDSTVRKAESYWLHGFQTFKIKVGNNFRIELEIIKQIRRRLPRSKIRIDANQNWSSEEAIENLSTLAEYDIEYCEEPLSNPTGEKLYRIQRQVDIPLALDESLYGNAQSREWISQKIGKFIIIKPMFFGSFQKIFETYRLAVTHEYTTVFTTSLESGIGRIMTATLASGLGAPQFAHGLATGSLLKMDVWHDRAYINSGYFNMPDGYGLGEKRRPTIQDLVAEPLDL